MSPEMIAILGVGAVILIVEVALSALLIGMIIGFEKRIHWR